MKKLNATNAIAILSLGLTLSVVVAGCGGGNDTAESAVTKNAKPEKAGTTDGGAGGDSSKPEKAGTTDGGAGGGSTTSDTKTGISDGGAGGGSTTSDTKTGISDGGTGESVTVSDSELLTYSTNNKKYEVPLTPVQMNALTSAQWEKIDGFLSASQVASIPTKTIQSLTTAALEGLSAAGTQALTTEQLNSMSKEQLNALKSPSDNTAMELTDAQLETVNARLTKLG